MLKRIKDKMERDGFKSLLRSAKVNFFFKLESEILYKTRFKPLCFRKPRIVYIELTNVCNLKCLSCYRDRTTGFMRKTLLLSLITECASIGGVSLVLNFGGESLMHPNIKEFLHVVNYFRKCFYKVSLTTNGMLLNSEISRLLVRYRFDWVTVSVDGVGKLGEKLRPGSNFNQIIGNIKNLVNLRDNFGDGKHPIVSTNTVLTSQTDKDLEDLKEAFCFVDNVNFSGCITDRFNYVNMPRFKKLNPDASKKHLTSKCLQPFTNLCVMWNGDITFCCHNLKGLYPVGSAHDGLMRVWRSNEMWRNRKAISLNTRFPVTICNECLKFSSGRG